MRECTRVEFISMKQFFTKRMPSSRMWCLVALIRTEVSEEHTAHIIRVKGISKLEMAWVVTRNWNLLRRNNSVLQLLVNANANLSSLILFTLLMGTMCSSETSIPAEATRRHNSESGNLTQPFTRPQLQLKYMPTLIWGCTQLSEKHDKDQLWTPHWSPS
jgi:hypothetical protein